jgi:hypothetical protein
MLKRGLVILVVLLACGVALASGAGAASIVPPGDAVSATDDVTGAKFCPIRIFCKIGTKARCHYSVAKHRCVCRCVPKE